MLHDDQDYQLALRQEDQVAERKKIDLDEYNLPVSVEDD